MNATHHAALDALRNDEGNVENKSLKKNPKRRRHLRAVETEATPVEITRAPVEAWQCDSCPTTGDTWPQMQRHVEDSHHQSFSKR